MQLNQVFDVLLDLQKKLHSEYASSASLDEVFNQNLNQLFEEDFLRQSISDKHYYTRILSLLYYFKENKFILPDSKVLLLENVSVEKKAIPQIFSIYKDSGEINLLNTIEDLSNANALTPILIDLLTYSIIPSIYVMFLENKTFDLFCDLITALKEYNDNGQIKKIKKNEKEISLHYYLSRSLFISPMSLGFIRRIMYPFLQPFYNGQLTEDYIDNFLVDAQNKLLQSFKENMCFIPSYIQMFFQRMNDTKNFLIECVFNPMCENPEIFLIIDNSITDFEDKMNAIKYILKSIFTEKIIDKIAELINASKYSEKSLFIHEEKKKTNLQKAYQKVVNSIDFYVFEKITKFVEELNTQNSQDNNDNMIDLIGSLNISNIQIYSSYFDNEIIKEKTVIYEQTQLNMGNSDCWSHFRKLVKDALPIPINYTFPEATIDSSKYEPFLALTKDLFVDTFDPFTSINAQIAYNIFEDRFLKYPNSRSVLSSFDTFKETMNGLVNVHKEQAVAMKKMSQFRAELSHLISKKINSIELMQELYNTILTNTIQKDYNSKEFAKLPKYCIDILSDPVKYKNIFQKYLIKQNTESLKLLGCNCDTIWYHRFYHSLDFNNFCAYRTDLHKYDDIARKGFKKFLTLFLKSNSVESKKVKKVLPCMYLFNDYFKQFNEAFESNCDPLTKMIKIQKAMDLILLLFYKEFNADEETDRQQLRFLVFSIISPPRFVSNMVYLLEYLFNTSKSVVTQTLFVYYFVPFQIIFQVIEDNTFVNDHLYYLSRPHRKNLDIFITGSNSNSISKLLKIFVKSMQGRIPSDEELDQYDELIRNNPKKQFSFFVKFASLSSDYFSNTLSVCALATIYVGKNIQFTSDSNPDMSIGFYAYQYEKGLLKNKIIAETNDFVNTNSIPNANKLVIYETDAGIKDLKLPNTIQSVSYKETVKPTSIILNKFQLA